MTYEMSPKGSQSVVNGSHIYIVIPVHNRWELTRKCLLSLREQSDRRVTTVIVDDGSTDDTSRAIELEFPNVVVLRGDGSLWWTGATNLGIEWVLQRCDATDYVLTLNNDTTMKPDYVETLVGIAETEYPALVGSVAVDSRDRETIVDGGPRVNWWTASTWSDNVGRSLSTSLREGRAQSNPDMLAGRGTLIPVACFREIGLYDAKRLPHYAADYEFSVRAVRAGHVLVMSYQAPVFSVVDASGVSTKRGRLPWKSFFVMFASRRSPACLLYRWRFARLAAPRRLMPVFLVADTARVVGGALRDQLLSARS